VIRAKSMIMDFAVIMNFAVIMEFSGRLARRPPVRRGGQA